MSRGKDIIVWSSAKGAYIGAWVGAADIKWDDEENRAYYGATNVSTRAILGEQVSNPQAERLREVLPS